MEDDKPICPNCGSTDVKVKVSFPKTNIAITDEDRMVTREWKIWECNTCGHEWRTPGKPRS
jgi:ribosomal protein L37AE/L43A